ncbi:MULTISPECIES: ABC transporter ATP-binding protein [Agrobacterium tumefaciens complex]|jgi:peptide/nickel transport system ATP-binding protein|uniref:Peptide/nickel transport system ATP-binding protein n=3 Tax=Agrobacterium tumefaciens complex TaxID=1183400 RepID=A0AAW8LX33_AGRTU|nr:MULTISPECIES: ABC transporter ATP-binding protein [Agrobacterium tumefaciens complex]TGE78419.1 ABC transporter ATP-binding protein [Rhizobium sp. SEMIA 439]AYM84686.1 peptide/nickel transport system ATP-binding protein [Agrobacterium tumefaciens]EPR20142.1 peptide ABC transporter ATPase [Agrobacterium radiobacter DSM 30147]KAA1232831.1 ABC transporter ATP-binding protein [Agrobacterium tumefaciens]KAB0458140.1 ABC transporter ATP-binding protein [Agrobacterium tumefaciens]
MVAAQNNAYAPAIRLDADDRKDNAIIDARNIAVTFKVEHGTVEAVKDISFQLYRGETIAIVGESGSGKSVTARTVMGLLTKRATISKSAVVRFNGEDILKFSSRQRRALRGNRISMIFQEPMSSLNPIYTIGSQIVEAIRVHSKLSRKEAEARALDLLRQVQIPEPEARLKQYPHQLSGGQRQRVMIAMALSNDPDVLIADEPTTALDVTVQAQILNLIRDLQKKRGMAVVLITHDLTIVKQFSDYVYVMQHGEMREHNTTEQLFAAPQHPYTKRLLASEPQGTAKPLPENSGVLLTASGVRVSFMMRYGGLFKPELKELIAVDSLGLTLNRHETLGLVGESGSGKTTFGQSLLRLNEPVGGEVIFDGERVDGRSRAEMRPLRSRMQIVFQDPFASLNPRMTIGQIIEEGLIINGLGRTKTERLDRVRDALEAAGMPGNILSRFPHEFSGGQRQRIAIARAVALEPEFILLDEPTSALDLSVQAQIIDLLRKLQDERGLSYLFISHDLKVVRALCHRVIVMQRGQIVEQGPVEDVLTNPNTEYTQRLVRAAFEIA